MKTYEVVLHTERFVRFEADGYIISEGFIEFLDDDDEYIAVFPVGSVLYWISIEDQVS